MSTVHRFLGNVNVAGELPRTKALSLIAIKYYHRMERGQLATLALLRVFTRREVIFGSFVVLRACVITN